MINFKYACCNTALVIVAAPPESMAKDINKDAKTKVQSNGNSNGCNSIILGSIEGLACG